MNSKLTPLNFIFLLLVIYFISGFIIYPLISLIGESLTSNNDISFYSYKNLLSGTSTEAALNSILVSLYTVIGSGTVGVLLAYIIHFHKIPLKSIFSSLLLIPIAAPPLVGVVAFLFLLNENGLISRAIMQTFSLSSPVIRFDGWTAILTVHIYSFYPFFFIFVNTALQKLDMNIIYASYSLGASKIKTFFNILFPMLMPSLVSASLIVFMASMASFSAPFIFGGSSRFLTTEIFSAKINGESSFAASLSILLTIVSLLFLLLLRWFRSRKMIIYSGKGTPARIRFNKNEKSNLSGTIIVYTFSFIILLPILTLFFLSFIPEGSLMRNVFAEPFTTENYLKIFNEPQFTEPFFNSLEMSAVAVVICLITGVSGAFFIAKKKFPGKNFLEGILSLPYGIPGTVIALSLIISYNTPSIFTGMEAIVGTFIIIPIAYAVRNVPLITQSSLSALYALDPSLEEASSSLGATGSRTFRRITLPLIIPAVVSGALLVFINSVGEFVSTILLYSFDTRTIAVEIYSQLRLYNTGTAAAYGIILFFMVMIVVYFSRRAINRSYLGS